MSNHHEYAQVKRWADKNGFVLLEQSFMDYHHELQAANHRLTNALEDTGGVGPSVAAFERLRLEHAAKVYVLRQQNNQLCNELERMARLYSTQIPAPTVIVASDVWDRINKDDAP